MQKKTRKLTLQKETLRRLTDDRLQDVVAGTDTGGCPETVDSDNTCGECRWPDE